MLIISTLFLCGCGKTTATILVDSIEISKKNLYLAEGQTAVISAQVYPFNADKQDYTFESSDNSIVTIEDGFVTAKKSGNATISATSTDGGYVDKCNVLVVKASDDLELNNFNNLNMPAKELEPIYNSDDYKKSQTSARKIAQNIGTKVNTEITNDIQSAKDVFEQFKTELQSSISQLNEEKTNLQNVANSKAESNMLDMFSCMQTNVLDSIISIKSEMLEQINNAEQEIDDDNYTIENQNGVTFVVIKNNANQ